MLVAPDLPAMQRFHFRMCKVRYTKRYCYHDRRTGFLPDSYPKYYCSHARRTGFSCDATVSLPNVEGTDIPIQIHGLHCRQCVVLNGLNPDSVDYQGKSVPVVTLEMRNMAQMYATKDLTLAPDRIWMNVISDLDRQFPNGWISENKNYVIKLVKRTRGELNPRP